jgi:uncharacterized membrane protein
MNPLTKIKTIHTIIWLFFNVVILYLLYAVIINKIDVWVWICVILVGLEIATLLVFKWFCPLTVWARKYSQSTKHNFDIYLPEWLAKYNKLIYGSIFTVSIIILLYRLLRN